MENGLVVKSNDLIQARYELGLMEQKIILYAVSQIDAGKDEFNKVQIEVKTITTLVDSTIKRYTEFREIANKLMDRKVYLADRPNLDIRWLASSEYLGDGIIELEFSSKLTPYLLQLKKKFTRYQLKNILYLKNKYSIRIYELLKQYENIRKREFELLEFKSILMLEENQYNRIYDFERYILKPSMKEINKYTDLSVNYEKVTKGRKVIGIKYTVSSKENREYINYLNENYDIADIKQLSGIDKENFNTKQVMDLYEIAVEKIINDDISPFEYIKLNYIHMLENKAVRNKYSYLKKALKEDYAIAIGQLKLKFTV